MIRRRHRRLKVCHRRGHFPPPLRRLPLVTSRHLLTCRRKTRHSYSEILFEP